MLRYVYLLNMLIKAFFLNKNTNYGCQCLSGMATLKFLKADCDKDIAGAMVMAIADFFVS